MPNLIGATQENTPHLRNQSSGLGPIRVQKLGLVRGILDPNFLALEP